MLIPIGLLLLTAVCKAQDEPVDIEASQISEREPLFFYTLTFTLTATVSTAASTTVSAGTTCTALSANAQPCAGKRRRGISFLDDFIQPEAIIEPSAVQTVEATQAPETGLDWKREARQAQYFFGHVPLLPTFPIHPRFNAYHNRVSPYFRQGSLDNEYGPSERFLLAFTTVTSTRTTSTSTITSFTTTTTVTLNCIASWSVSACPGSG